MRPAVALFAVVLGLLPVAGCAAPVLTPPDAGIDGLMQAYDGQVPGAAVLVLHDIEGWKHQEIAEQLQMAVGSSKAQLHRARGLLRARLGDMT